MAEIVQTSLKSYHFFRLWHWFDFHSLDQDIYNTGQFVIQGFQDNEQNWNKMATSRPFFDFISAKFVILMSLCNTGFFILYYRFSYHAIFPAISLIICLRNLSWVILMWYLTFCSKFMVQLIRFVFELLAKLLKFKMAAKRSFKKN